MEKYEDALLVLTKEDAQIIAIKLLRWSVIGCASRSGRRFEG
ncbi:MAG: hypothetical protein WAV32_05305 [Halobacteriota archaeon]